MDLNSSLSSFCSMTGSDTASGSTKAVGRFAPSPTGYMHLGNARTALLVWLQMRALNGKLILRIEDIDVGRSRDFAYDAIRQDIDWLGLNWDQEYLQSQRLEIYQTAVKQLQTYPCACTRKDIQQAASAPHAAESVYPGLCRQQLSHPDKPTALRWLTPDINITVNDLRLGSISQHLPTCAGDIVLRRNDGCYAYHLAVVVDDGLMGVTHILRGEDLWSAAPLQVGLQQALGFNRPVYLHAPLMRDYLGERLAKRNGAPSVSALREQGESPERVLAELARSLGWSVPDKISAQDLLTHYGERVILGRI